MASFINIYTRSPYFVEVDDAGITGSRILLWIWRADQVQPVTPTYVRDKLIPTSNNTQMLYNISNFVNEYYGFTEPKYDYNIIDEQALENEYVFVRYRVLITTNTIPDYKNWSEGYFRAFYGWGTFEQGYNPNLGNIHMDSGTYYYYTPHLEPTEWPIDVSAQQPTLQRWGSFRFISEGDWTIYYTDLVTGAQVSYYLNSTDVRRMFLIYALYWEHGNLVEIYNGSNDLLASFKMLPQCECKYDVVVCDFVNKYGEYQRTWFYKLNKTTANVVGQEYNLMARDVFKYDIRIGQRQQFNVNGKESISCNSGWVNEEYADVIQQLILSENVQINGKPAKVLTKSVEYQQGVNTKMINYKVDFEYAYDTINSII